MKYKISSRATILLGRESVSRVDGAIIELIKNTYDADASFCVVYFDIDNDKIYILDNGDGMTEDIIENHWMTIGTDDKRENYLSDKDRIKSGEKGIGRFALDRLGSKCTMYTKHMESDKLIKWSTDWTSFEQPGKNLEDIEADFEYLNVKFTKVIPNGILADLEEIMRKLINEQNRVQSFESDILRTGTMFVIEELRDGWTKRSIKNLINAMGYLIPPSEQNEYVLLFKENYSTEMLIIDNEVTEEYDYKIIADFDGDLFHIQIMRNEFDLDRIPSEVFDMERFSKKPYQKKDFKSKAIDETLSISQLMSNVDDAFIKTVQEIGTFRFDYTFMKMTIQDDSNETFYYKEISKNRKIWLTQNSGVKLYRDNFLVRPYGDSQSDAFDWLGLDARRATNPASLSHPSGNWRVRNKQGQGSIYISRITNQSILDMASREGVIENNSFRALKGVIVNIISRFERDRAYIGYTMKLFSDKVSEKQKTKHRGKNIAKRILEGKEKSKKTRQQNEKETETLAKTVKFYEEEREELISEVKLLRSLATNGLITTSIVHDLKGINSMLVIRVDSLSDALDKKNEALIKRNLEDFKKNDIFLKSWISVVTNQIKSDKRRRLKKDLYTTIREIIHVLNPILVQKKIEVDIICDENQISKRIFVSDFESIIYNLLINSIESFEKSKQRRRKVKILLEANEEFVMIYEDNGKGLDKAFKNPYDIFDFGTTSKYDINGDQTGTGLGMYIVASTIREYNATYKIIENANGFGLEMSFPL
ncbi:sensor histidine kinase [Alkaliphilus sp. AH-315-G20]|nr:sensor histidine kinase [Alkaliphilus sp. AH-315-G20]